MKKLFLVTLSMVFSLLSFSRNYSNEYNFSADNNANNKVSISLENNWQGKWITNWGGSSELIIYFTQTNGKVTGTYDFKDGKIEATVIGNTLKGTWTQSNNRGWIEFELSSDKQSFTGKWGYANGESGGVWNGKKAVEEKPEVKPEVKKEISFKDEWEGKWDTYNGILSIKISGNKMTGTSKLGKLTGIVTIQEDYAGTEIKGTYTYKGQKYWFDFYKEPDSDYFYGETNPTNVEGPAEPWEGTRAK